MSRVGPIAAPIAVGAGFLSGSMMLAIVVLGVWLIGFALRSDRW